MGNGIDPNMDPHPPSMAAWTEKYETALGRGEYFRTFAAQQFVAQGGPHTTDEAILCALLAIEAQLDMIKLQIG